MLIFARVVNMVFEHGFGHKCCDHLKVFELICILKYVFYKCCDCTYEWCKCCSLYDMQRSSKMGVLCMGRAAHEPARLPHDREKNS